MKILVLSDSHSGLSFMRACISGVCPDCVIHLGDYVDDGQAMAQEFPEIRFYQVAGNCDRWRNTSCPEVLLETIGGVRIFMSHGHLHNVKVYPDKLIMDAGKAGAQIALYGHTHCADCRLMQSGMWVLNPGTCGSYGGTAGIIEIRSDGEISCSLISALDLEEKQ